jgi:hypothetical protein
MLPPKPRPLPPAPPKPPVPVEQPEPDWPYPKPEVVAAPRLPTLEDCQTRDVHYFKTGLFGLKPECGHHTVYKQCNNCGKVIWTGCIRCQEEKSKARSLAERVKRKGIIGSSEKKNQNQK